MGKLLIWYRFFSLGTLFAAGIMTAQIVLLEPFRGFRGILVLTNAYGEGWPEFVMILLSLPGWVILFLDSAMMLKREKVNA